MKCRPMYLSAWREGGGNELLRQFVRQESSQLVDAALGICGDTFEQRTQVAQHARNRVGAETSHVVSNVQRHLRAGYHCDCQRVIVSLQSTNGRDPDATGSSESGRVERVIFKNKNTVKEICAARYIAPIPDLRQRTVLVLN